MPKRNPSQTVRQYSRVGLCSEDEFYSRILTGDMATPTVKGQRIRIEGTVYAGAGDPIADCMLEVRQADSEGHLRNKSGIWDDGFTGVGRTGTNAAGQFEFNTIMPGCLPGSNGTLQAPHLTLIVHMRGTLLHVVTRIYFEDRAAANAQNPVLKLVPGQWRTSITARRCSRRKKAAIFHFDIQARREAVFFDI